jgi:iron complex outermembrane recepter protein
MQIKVIWRKHNFRQYLWSESLSFRLGLAVAAILIAIPLQVRATNIDRSSSSDTTNIRTVRNSQQLLAQADSAPLNITGIKLNPKNSGIEVILETAGTLAAPAPQIVGNLLYFDIPNATISQPFQAANPAPGVGSVSVTQINPSFVRVAVIGTNGAPQATVIAGVAGANPEPIAQTNEPELEVNVTGLRYTNYRNTLFSPGSSPRFDSRQAE